MYLLNIHTSDAYIKMFISTFQNIRNRNYNTIEKMGGILLPAFMFGRRKTELQKNYTWLFSQKITRTTSEDCLRKWPQKNITSKHVSDV